MPDNKCVSLYTYKEGFSFELVQDKCITDSENALKTITEKFEKKAYRNTEKTILYILTKYRYLTTPLLNILLEYSDYITRKKNNYSSNIKELTEDGALQKLRLSRPGEVTKEEVVVYTLSPAAMAYISGMDTIIQKNFPPIRTAKILESLSLSQWHIKILSEYTDWIKKDVFKGNITNPRRKTAIHVDSYIKIKPTEGVFKRKDVSLFATSWTKEHDIARVVNEIVQINQYMQENSGFFRHIIIVVITESLDAIKTAYRRLTEYSDMIALHLYFSTDEDCTYSHLLNRLYCCCYAEDSTDVIIRKVQLLPEK